MKAHIYSLVIMRTHNRIDLYHKYLLVFKPEGFWGFGAPKTPKPQNPEQSEVCLEKMNSIHQLHNQMQNFLNVLFYYLYYQTRQFFQHLLFLNISYPHFSLHELFYQFPSAEPPLPRHNFHSYFYHPTSQHSYYIPLQTSASFAWHSSQKYHSLPFSN
ncbi:hypothetical protein FGO68_gene9152 [Halteria grandinella]|uniref:Uncharacterized protein n=1 Tax=Halteria grandinella TaxID=5974 RepID=A0A8J8P2S9_HALGN|nr:hypothetical protein FGO68_gene9152 [Halteria grandinella]